MSIGKKYVVGFKKSSRHTKNCIQPCKGCVFSNTIFLFAYKSVKFGNTEKKANGLEEEKKINLPKKC